jgi:hypothetical protein
MKKWLTGTRGTVVMILTWTVGWGLGFAGLIEAFVDPHGEFLDVWPTAMAIPGFLGGVVFSALLRIAEGRRSFDEASLARAAAWGGVTGLLLAVIAATGVAGLISRVISHVALGLAAAFGAGSDNLRGPAAIVIMAGLSAVAGVGSSVFFRLVARRQTPAVAGPQA